MTTLFSDNSVSRTASIVRHTHSSGGAALDDPRTTRWVGSTTDPNASSGLGNSSGGQKAGFCPAAAPYLPLADDYPQVNVAAERDYPASMLTLTRRPRTPQGEEPPLMAGAYRVVGGGTPDDCFVYVRQSGTRRILVTLNFSGEGHTVRSAAGRSHIVASTHPDRGPPITQPSPCAVTRAA